MPGTAKRGLEQFGQYPAPFAAVPPGNEDAVWFAYMPICTSCTRGKRATAG